MTCKQCGGTHYIFVADEMRPCPCLIAAKVNRYLSVLGKTWAGVKSMSEVQTLARLEHPLQNLLIQTTETDVGVLNSYLAVFLLKELIDYDVLYAFDLLEVMMGQHLKYSTPASIKVPRLIILYGYGETISPRVPSLLIQVMDSRVRLGLSTWLVIRGDIAGEVWARGIDNHFGLINIDRVLHAPGTAYPYEEGEVEVEIEEDENGNPVRRIAPPRQKKIKSQIDFNSKL